jgi:two-component system, sensor histidine kinase
MSPHPDELPTTPPVRILVVEDNPDGRQALRLLLELLGHEVIVAEDGEQGVTRGLAYRPDVALIDIGLPRLDGYEVARRLRRGLGSRVLLIAHTAYGRPQDREEALAAGFDVHFVKPLALGDLAAWLRRAGTSRVSQASVTTWS